MHEDQKVMQAYQCNKEFLAFCGEYSALISDFPTAWEDHLSRACRTVCMFYNTSLVLYSALC